MGRLEKQIIIGALALVGVLLAVVVFKGLKPHEEVDKRPPLFIPLNDEVSVEVTAPKKDPIAKKQQEVFPDFKPPVRPQIRPENKVKSEPRLKPKVKPGVSKPKVSKPRMYTIRPNDTLSEIAQKQLGSLRRLSEILDLNPGLDKNHLVPGEKLVLPGKGSKVAAATTKKDAGKVSEASARGRTHTVAAGDSLWSIAEKYYGKGYKVDRILAANPKLLPNKNTVLNIGWVLSVPK